MSITNTYINTIYFIINILRIFFDLTFLKLWGKVGQKREGWEREKEGLLGEGEGEKETNCIISKSKGGKLERVGLREWRGIILRGKKQKSFFSISYSVGVDGKCRLSFRKTWTVIDLTYSCFSSPFPKRKNINII